MRYSHETRRHYKSWYKRLYQHIQKPTSQWTFADVEAFFLSLTHLAPSTVINAHLAIRATLRTEAVWQTLMPEFREAFTGKFAALRPRKHARQLPLSDTSLISPDTAEAWLSAVSPAPMRLACWLCYDPGLDAAVVARMTRDEAARIAVPVCLQSALTQQINRANADGSPYLFPAKDPTQPVTPYALQEALRRAKKNTALALPSGAGFRLLQVVGIVRRLREEGIDPEQVRRDAGIADHKTFTRYLDLAS